MSIAMDINMSDLITGFIGAILALIFEWIGKTVVANSERKKVLEAIAGECTDNLSILDQVVHGAITGGTFKRMKVTYFNDVDTRKDALRLPEDVRKSLSQVIIDLELLNREVDFAFDHSVKGSGQVSLPLQTVISNARNGVCGSLKALKKTAKDAAGIKGDSDE